MTSKMTSELTLKTWMKRGALLFCVAFLLTGAIVTLANETMLTSADARRPNILLIMTDDQGYGDKHVQLLRR